MTCFAGARGVHESRPSNLVNAEPLVTHSRSGSSESATMHQETHSARASQQDSLTFGRHPRKPLSKAQLGDPPSVCTGCGCAFSSSRYFFFVTVFA